MKFDRSLGGGQLAGNLFVKETRGNERQNFALARCKLLVALAQLFNFRSVFAFGSVPGNRSADGVQKKKFGLPGR